jgi:hypothetical protein
MADRVGVFDIVVVEANAPVGQLVDTRRWRHAAIHAKISPADVVHEKEHNIGLRFLREGGRASEEQSGQNSAGQPWENAPFHHEPNLHSGYSEMIEATR